MAKKISELDAIATALATADLFVVVKNVAGTLTTLKFTGQDLLDFVGGGADINALLDSLDTDENHGAIIYRDETGWKVLPAGPVGYRLVSTGEGEAPSWEAPTGDGDVEGPASSTDNTLPRYDGVTGKLLQGTGIVVTDLDELSGYKANVNDSPTGTTYTVDATDAGKIIDHSNAAAITVTLPNSLPKGFSVTYCQKGAGQITFSAAGGATLANRQSHTKTAGQNAMVTLFVRSNSGTNAAWVLGGDTAA